MLVKRDSERKLRGEDIPHREITDHGVYLNRRAFMTGAAALTLAPWGREASAQGNLQPLQAAKNPAYQVQDALTPYKSVTTYNNFYEFGTDKGDPAAHGASLKTRPWTVQVDGLCAKPKTFDIEELLKFPLEDRVYRLRCVEAWSMIIPWIGFPLSALLKRVEPTGQAKYVEFTTLVNPGMFSRAEARALRIFPRLAVHGRAAARRGDAPAHPRDGWAVRPGAAQSERRADPRDRAVEVRLQRARSLWCTCASPPRSPRPPGTRLRPTNTDSTRT